MNAILEKAKRVRLLILDVDGVLTSGIIYFDDNGEQAKGFHVHDGFGMRMLQKYGIKIAVITAKHSKAVSHRVKDLKIEHVYLGQENKIHAYEDVKNKLSLTDAEIAYVGDDLPDLPLLRRVGLAITVPSAVDIIRQHAHFITAKTAGKGAVREVCELLLRAQNHYQTMLESYM